MRGSETLTSREKLMKDFKETTKRLMAKITLANRLSSIFLLARHLKHKKCPPTAKKPSQSWSANVLSRVRSVFDLNQSLNKDSSQVLSSNLTTRSRCSMIGTNNDLQDLL